MVSSPRRRCRYCVIAFSFTVLGAGADQQPPLLERLSPDLRAIVLMALAALVLVGLGLVGFVWLGGRHVRRLARNRPPGRIREVSDWDRKQPLREPDGGSDGPAES